METKSNDLLKSLGDKADRNEGNLLQRERAEGQIAAGALRERILDRFEEIKASPASREELVRFLVRGRFAPFLFSDAERVGVEAEVRKLLG